MAITFIGSAWDDDTGGADLTPVLPAHNSGDVGILVLHANGASGVFTVAGWTLLKDRQTTIGADITSAIYYRVFTSGSETDPTAELSTSNTWGAAVHVFRDVDNTEPFEDPGALMISAADLPTAIDEHRPTMAQWLHPNGASLRAMCVSNEDITTPGTPSGYTDAEVRTGASYALRQMTTAYDLDMGVTERPDTEPFGHANSVAGREYHSYIVRMRQDRDVNLHSISANTFQLGAIGLVVTGEGFGASQGSGQVYLADSQDAGTSTKQAQDITSWSDTSITFDLDEGALGEGVHYILVYDGTNYSGHARVFVGLVPYADLIEHQDPDHNFTFQQTLDDAAQGNQFPCTQDQINSISYENLVPQCEDGDYSLRMANNNRTRGFRDSPWTTSGYSGQERTIAGWCFSGSGSTAGGVLYKEGTTDNIVIYTIGQGFLLAQYESPNESVTAISNVRARGNRPQHVAMRISISNSEIAIFVDGVKQTIVGTITDDEIAFVGAGRNQLGRPNAPESLDLGTLDSLIRGYRNMKLARWCFWSDDSPGGGYLTDAKIRELFELGATADETIATDTEANMQTALDAFADTEMADWPCALRVEAVTGGGDFELVADNVTQAPDAGIEVQYMGQDTLTWVNANGATLDPAKVSTPRDGTVTILERVDITVTVLDINTEAAIENARVRITNDAGGGVVLDGLTNASGVLTGTFDLTASIDVSGRVRKSTSGDLYKTADIVDSIGLTGRSITVLMVPDE